MVITSVSALFTNDFCKYGDIFRFISFAEDSNINLINLVMLKIHVIYRNPWLHHNGMILNPKMYVMLCPDDITD